MKTSLWLLLAGLFPLLLTGCATSTIETRKQERQAAYAALAPDQKAAVDAAQIKVGMSMDAVYLAWGKPSQVLTGESSNGPTVTWLYQGTYLQEYRYWSYHPYYYGRGFYGSPYLDYDYYPRSYIKAEVIFENGKVKEWRSLPRPGY